MNKRNEGQGRPSETREFVPEDLLQLRAPQRPSTTKSETGISCPGEAELLLALTCERAFSNGSAHMLMGNPAVWLGGPS